MFGLLIGAAAAKALNKWDGGRTRRGEVGLPPPQFWGLGYYPRKICEDIDSNLCSLMHFGVKNKHFKQNHSNVHQLPISSLNYHLQQTLARLIILFST